MQRCLLVCFTLILLNLSTSVSAVSCLSLCKKKVKVHFVSQDEFQEEKENLGSYLDFYNEYIAKNGLKEGWPDPHDLIDDLAFKELDLLISYVKDAPCFESLSRAEKIAYLCAQNIRLQVVTFPLIEANILVLRKNYLLRNRFESSF